MATSPEAAVLTTQHWQAQRQVRAAITAESLRLWQMLTPEDIDALRDPWLAATVLATGRWRDRSTAVSASYYRSFAQAETGLFRDLPTIGTSFDTSRLEFNLAYNGPARFKHLVGRGYDPFRAFQVAGVAVTGVASRFALDGGRDEVRNQTQRDPQAIGFLRVTAQDPCAFCAMLASRGPVFKSPATARGGRWSQKDQAFKVHDHCNCTTEPMFDKGADWPGRGREFNELWDEAQADPPDGGASGTSNDALNNFRRLLSRT